MFHPDNRNEDIECQPGPQSSLHAGLCRESQLLALSLLPCTGVHCYCQGSFKDPVKVEFQVNNKWVFFVQPSTNLLTVFSQGRRMEGPRCPAFPRERALTQLILLLCGWKEKPERESHPYVHDIKTHCVHLLQK